MSTENIVEKILFDANADAETIVAEAEAKAAKILADASSRSEKLRRDTEAEIAKRRESILEKRAADARLESAKIVLREKRKVVDTVYSLALSRMVALEKEDALKLADTLLQKYAEEGDTLYFAENFRYGEEVSALPVIEQRGVKVSLQRLPLDGGMRLEGRIADKDLSFGAILATDRETYQAKLAVDLFR